MKSQTVSEVTQGTTDANEFERRQAARIVANSMAKEIVFTLKAEDVKKLLAAYRTVRLAEQDYRDAVREVTHNTLLTLQR